MITLEELEQLLALGHETRSFEVKGPGSRKDKAFCAKVARAVMAMGNMRDGGLVCIGIDDKRMPQMFPGLGHYLAEWSEFDDVSATLGRYVDPPVDFNLQPFCLASSADVVVLEVAEFQDIPHICKRDYPGELQEGMVYVRPRGKPESIPIPSTVEMRELIDLATNKGVREFVRRAGGAGIQLAEKLTSANSAMHAFDNEYAAAWGEPGPVVNRVLALGHTDVAIRPTPHDPARVSPERLLRFVEQHAVRLRGWPVPFIDDQQPVQRHGSWIGQDVEPQIVPHMEAWRQCTSGQFLHRRALATDMRDSPMLTPTVSNAVGTVAVWDVLLYLVEVAEFGARVATTFENEAISFDVQLRGIRDRQLISGVWERNIPGQFVVATEALGTARMVPTAALIANPRNVGVTLTQELLRQFGLDLPDQVLFDWQEEILDRRHLKS